MDTNDRRLIDGLATEINKAQPVAKDAEAAALISQRIASQPDAVYVLTQAVLLQQDALRNAQARLENLERQGQPRRGGLFSGLFGGSSYGQPAAGRSYGYQQASGRPAGSSFLAQAATTAAGVAGGMFLFEGISNLFDGGVDQGIDGAFDQIQDFDQSGFDGGLDV